MSLHDRLYKSVTDHVSSSIQSTIQKQVYKQQVTPYIVKDKNETFMFYLYMIAFALFLLFILKHSLKRIFLSNDSFSKHLFQKHRNFQPEQEVDRDATESKIEYAARKAAERVFQKQFKKIRPTFLLNEVTGKNLEIDLYNEELKLAIEVQGQQHYKYIPYFHRNYEAYQCQRYRDVIKKLLLQKQHIHLIEIPYNVKPEDMDHYLRVRTIELGLKV